MKCHLGINCEYLSTESIDQHECLFITHDLHTVCKCQRLQLRNFCEMFSCQIEDVENNIRGCENELDMIDRSLRLKKMSDGER